jgi:hypothetical protein
VDYFLHHGWPGQVLYFGQIYLPTELPWHYGPLLLAMTTPLAVFLLFGAGVFRIIRQNITLWRDRQSYQVENQELFSNRQAVVFFAGMLFLSWIFFRLLLSVMPGAVRYDGIRHFLPLLPAISVIAAIGLSAFMESILQCCGKWSKSLKNGILAAILLSLIWEFSTAYPFGDSYFNEGTRIIMGPHLEKVIEVEYWGPSYRQGVRWLNQNAAENAQVCVPLADHLLQFYPIRSDIQFQCDLGANYLMFITRYAYLPANLDEIFRYSQLKPVYRISRQGSDLLLIYKLDK